MWATQLYTKMNGSRNNRRQRGARRGCTYRYSGAKGQFETERTAGHFLENILEMKNQTSWYGWIGTLTSTSVTSQDKLTQDRAAVNAGSRGASFHHWRWTFYKIPRWGETVMTCADASPNSDQTRNRDQFWLVNHSYMRWNFLIFGLYHTFGGSDVAVQGWKQEGTPSLAFYWSVGKAVGEKIGRGLIYLAK